MDFSQDDLIEGWPLPALLRGAGAAYGSAIRRALAELGSDDLPPSGPYVIGAVGQATVPLGAIIRQLGMSKQAAGQLVDTLVVRGYLTRSSDPTDRRRLVIHLTERGEAAAALIRSAVEGMEADLRARLGTEPVLAARGVLASLIHSRLPDA